MRVKEDKIDVHYRNGYKTTICGNCTMFLPPRDCTDVKGTISPNAVCDLFEAKTEAKAKAS